MEEQPSVRTTNMEFAPSWDNDASVLQNDDVEAERKDELPIRLIPGYPTFDDYLQVCLSSFPSNSSRYPFTTSTFFTLNILASNVK